MSIVVGTFGDVEKWGPLAERAIRSAEEQTLPAEGVYHVHERSLHEARNLGAEQAKGDWLIFLDGDDELDGGYVEAMTKTVVRLRNRPSLLQPATLGIVDGREDAASVVIPAKPLLDGNFMVIGTMVKRSQFMDVGGFLDWPLYEDWCLWIRCWQAGAKLLPVPEAVYRVHLMPDSRNNQDRKVQLETYNNIRRRYQKRGRR